MRGVQGPFVESRWNTVGDWVENGLLFAAIAGFSWALTLMFWMAPLTEAGSKRHGIWKEDPGFRTIWTRWQFYVVMLAIIVPTTPIPDLWPSGTFGNRALQLLEMPCGLLWMVINPHNTYSWVLAVAVGNYFFVKHAESRRRLQVTATPRSPRGI